jgi:hypothetical protein
MRITEENTKNYFLPFLFKMKILTKKINYYYEKYKDNIYSEDMIEIDFILMSDIINDIFDMEGIKRW